MANPRTIARLEAQIRRRAAYCLQFEVADPRATFITITRVELSSDLLNGKTFKIDGLSIPIHHAHNIIP